MKNFIPSTRHHKLAQVWGGTWNPNNIVNLREDIHRSFHQVFQADTPIQQQRRLLEANKTAMLPEVYSTISNVIKRYEGTMEVEVYEPRVIHTDTFISRMKSLGICPCTRS